MQTNFCIYRLLWTVKFFVLLHDNLSRNKAKLTKTGIGMLKHILYADHTYKYHNKLCTKICASPDGYLLQQYVTAAGENNARMF
jgi:hypothetical protein